MLHVLLTILKILLWIILGILGLLLLLVLLVLFAPIKYRVDAEYHGTAKVYARIKFLILSVRLRFDQENKDFQQDIRIAGFRLRMDKPAKDKKPKKAKKSKDDSVDFDALDEDIAGEDSEPVEGLSPVDEADIAVENNENADTSDNKVITEVFDESLDEKLDKNPDKKQFSDIDLDDSFVNEEFDLWNNEGEELPKEERSVFGRIKSFFTGLAAKVKSTVSHLQNASLDKLVEKISSKTEALRHKIDRLKKFWNMSCTVKTRAYLKKYIVGLLKHIGPRRIKGHIRYGFDEPYKTGQITGYLSLLPFVYQKGFSLEPDFYNKVIDGNISLRGKIRIGYIIRIALNVNLWRTIKLARKIMK